MVQHWIGDLKVRKVRNLYFQQLQIYERQCKNVANGVVWSI